MPNEKDVQVVDAIVGQLVTLPEGALDQVKEILARRTFRVALDGDALGGSLVDVGCSRRRAGLLLLSGDGRTTVDQEVIDLGARACLGTLKRHPSFDRHAGFALTKLHHFVATPRASKPVVLTVSSHAQPVPASPGAYVVDAEDEIVAEHTVRVTVRGVGLDGATVPSVAYDWHAVVEIGARLTFEGLPRPVAAPHHA